MRGEASMENLCGRCHFAFLLTLCRVGKSNREACFNLGQNAIFLQVELRRHAAGRSLVDMTALGLNNPCMPRPEAAHRIKSYSAATGYVYQYYFYEVEKSKRGAAAGTEYVYMVSVDRKHVFPVRIFVARD